MRPLKKPIVPGRIRRPPEEGWSWIDRRFLAEFAPRLGRDAVLLYFFLAAVSDKEGLSFYGDPAIAGRLRMSEAAVIKAREELEAQDLIAYRSGLYQVLSLPPRRSDRELPRLDSAPSLLADVLRRLSGHSSAVRPEEGREP